MGTRNLVCVILNHEYKVAQYGQWDGYPEGQGLTLLRFLRDKMDKKVFFNKLSEARWLTDDEIKKAYADAGADPNSSWVTFAVVEKVEKMLPLISRDHGAEVLELIQNSKGPVLLSDSSDFAADSLFCEFAYVVDFDNDRLEVYKGFNKRPLNPLDPNERFAGLLPADKEKNYYQVKHWQTFDLAALPSDEDFLATLNTNEDVERW